VPIDDDEIREHIELAVAPGGWESARMTARIVRACWPGGAQDRTERAALAWLRLWRPERAGPTLPACSCSTGRCLLCN
jgi:hypothetical protein